MTYFLNVILRQLGVTFFYPIIPMHEVVPSVVAIAVSIVMTKWMIFWISSFFIVGLGFRLVDVFLMAHR